MLLTWSNNLLATTFSYVFDNCGKLLTGLLFESTSGSRVCLLRSGMTIAYLRDAGTLPCERLSLMICVYAGASD